jgi:hypothetical protein
MLAKMLGTIRNNACADHQRIFIATLPRRYGPEELDDIRRAI